MTIDVDIEDFNHLPVDASTPRSTWSRIGDPRAEVTCPVCWEITLECECAFR